MNNRVIAFDIYGTLFNVSFIENYVREIAKDQAGQIAALWRNKQLEYTFRRALMKQYADFSLCSAQALEFAFLSYGYVLTTQQKVDLLNAYDQLPLFSDVVPALQYLIAEGFKIYAFSNGTRASVAKLLETAAIQSFFNGLVSADSIGTFKPDPSLYNYLLQITGTTKAQTRLVSSNPFDVIGARAFGIEAIWLKRDAAQIFDPWNIFPSSIITKLTDISQVILP